MHLGNANDRSKYSMRENGMEVLLKSPSEEKSLGIWIYDKLKFTNHTGHAVAKSNQMCRLIKPSFVYRDSEIIKRLFISGSVSPSRQPGHFQVTNVVRQVTLPIPSFSSLLTLILPFPPPLPTFP